jgi:hypothetical protein
VLRAAMRCQREHLADMVGRLPEEEVVELIEFVIKTYLGLDVKVQPR